MSKKTIPIPLIELGRLDHEHLPAGHPDLRGIDRVAADLGCTAEEARKILRDNGIGAQEWFRNLPVADLPDGEWDWPEKENTNET
jgi:hypothetical protein